MNTNQLKRFAQEARIKLIDQIGAKLEKVLTSDSVALREKADHLKKLQEAINKTSKTEVIDTVAYTWFNRFVALRFMDVNGYEPLGISIVSPIKDGTLPAILQEAKQGNIPEELPVHQQRIYDVLDGRIPSADAQNEAYAALLVGASNHLNNVFPFLFEKIDDFAELLLPDDLISSFSIIEDIRVGMQPEDCEEVEILGWLYQFYISALNEKLISSKKKYTKKELAPASQLFTPKWIVQYMVDNTLGQVWSEIRPDSKVIDTLEFYIKPTYTGKLSKRESKSIEEIKFFEPCVGSGHILSYAFDVFYKIYEEEGYNPSEIPALIITKNLFGVDIDRRAAQIASFVLLMKGRQKQRRFLRTVAKDHIEPNISFYQDFEFDNKFKNATAIGSLIEITPMEVDNFKIEENSLFAERQREVFKLYKLLGQRYEVVVTNPPYIKSSRMESSLQDYVESNYVEGRYDLYTAFVQQGLNLCKMNGYVGFMTPFVWMFILSFEDFRQFILNNSQINNLIQLEYSGFDGATVPICTYTLHKSSSSISQGNYIRLTDFIGSKMQGPKALEGIKTNDCSWRYKKDQSDYLRIPGKPIAYWIGEREIEIFESSEALGSIDEAKSGVMTGKDPCFLKYWQEISFKAIGFGHKKFDEIDYTKTRFLPMNKEEGFRKWSGRYKIVLNYLKDDLNFTSYDGLNYRLRDKSLYFQEGISWGNVTSSVTSYRFQELGLVFADKAPMIFTDKKYLVGVLNSKIAKYYREILNPTISFTIGDLHRLPIYIDKSSQNLIESKINSCINISDLEWGCNETSWNFQLNELIRIKGQDLQEAYDSYCQYWQNKFFELHKNEEELNSQFIDIYGLQDELTPEVPLKDITILKEETTIKKGVLIFRESEIMAQFISYAVGCMFGRYSLDKPGLILANQGETLETYLENLKVSNSKFKTFEDLTFVPDDDNVIPILDNEWFEDDIVNRFYAFLKATFGKQNFDKNLAFVEDSVGDIRKYFLKTFYTDHVKRYKKRPIYWLFSSPSGAFNALIYMHRYTPDTLNTMLNGYLKEYQEKLKAQDTQLEHVKNVGTDREKVSAEKEQARISKVLIELQEYDRELFKIATERIAIDLDDGVLVNYNKFGSVIKSVSGLNDKKTKDKVKKFDWIDTSTIQ